VTILDWRTQADPKTLTRAANDGTAKAKFDKGVLVMRHPSAVVGIMFHITACIFGVSPAAVKAAGGDARLAGNRRAQRIPAHATVFRDGDAVVPWPLLSYLYHGNAGNALCLGIEIESKDGTITAQQREVLAELVPWLIAEARREGAVISESWAHRQTNGNKPNDPGREVWQEVVIPLSEKHGLTRTIRALPRSTPKGIDGSPIPKAWDPLGV
jgi:hypothetical protein